MSESDPPKRRRRAPQDSPLSASDPVEIAMAAAASGKPLPDAARSVLEKHGRLIDAQVTELRMRHVGERVRAALWALLAIAALLLIGLIVSVVIKAARTDALIVQSFRVPPALAAKGLTGEVVATQVLDKLAEMQAATPSSRAASAYANNWEDDLKIDIPNTGATTDQVWRLLRGWLGKETRISGEVIDAGSGLTLTARVGSEPGRRFVDEKGDLDQLIKQGAESIFKSTQPYRFAIYLGRTERPDERLAVLKQLSTDPSPMERKWAFSGLAFDSNSRGRFREGLAYANRARAIDPNMLPAIGNASGARQSLGHLQEMVDLHRLVASLPIGKEFDAGQVEASRCGNHLVDGFFTRDPTELDLGAECIEISPSGFNEFVSVLRMMAAVLRHDSGPAVAFRMAASSELPEEDARSNTAYGQLIGQMERGASPALDAALRAHREATANPTDIRSRALLPTQDWPLQAEALAILGRLPEAQALIARTPLDCYECVRVRGLVAQRMGDRGGAQRWFLVAAKQGPRLPAAFLDWGKLLLDNKRYATAEVKLREAARLAPNWADPLKYWGDLLAAQGKRKEALTKYDAALKLAPKWAELQRARAPLART
jgi:tetratricopeptide (TPR) repeat protein